MAEITLQAESRTGTSRKSRALRREGMIPGIYYLSGEANIPITVSQKALQPLIYTTESHIVSLKLADGAEKKCILRDVQYDPVTDDPIHFDLQGLRENEEITLEIPIVIIGGTPQGVRDGGVLQQSIRKLKISCLPKHIPSHIDINAEKLTINEFIHVGDLKVENITVLANEDDTILGVIPPTVEKEPTPEVPVEEEAAEPEVIAKGKKPEEGEEGAPAEAKPEATPKSPAKEEKKQ